MKINKMINYGKMLWFFINFNISIISLRNCMEISLENLYVDASTNMAARFRAPAFLSML